MSADSFDGLKRLLPGVRYPIIQAPMAGTATPELAAAVSNAGGLGSLGIGSSTLQQARDMIMRTKSLTQQPFNVNVFCHQPAERDEAIEQAWIEFLTPLYAEFGVDAHAQLDDPYPSFVGNDDALEMLLETKPAVVSFHFGLPTPAQLGALRQAGITTFATATNLDDARTIADAGIDAIVAQGIEAGGHRGMFDPTLDDQRLPTAVLVRLLVREVGLPIIAAGGIMDGCGVRAMLDLGAVAAQLGTVFILCPESAASARYRESLKGARSSRTRLTPVISGRPARGMVNSFIEYCEAPGSPRPASYPVAYDAAKKLSAAAVAQGNHDYSAQWAGQGAPLAREMSAGMLVETLVRELISGAA